MASMDASFHEWMAKTQEDILEPDLPIIVSLDCKQLLPRVCTCGLTVASVCIAW